MNTDQSLRKHLLELLNGGHAHAAFDDVIADFPARFYGEVPKGLPHSAWELLEHMRIAQEDILDFSRNPAYREKKWPDDYWPPTPEPPDDAAWDRSVQQFQHDLKQLQELMADTKLDLLAKLAHGKGQ